ncbi:unnamed protein product, partial [Phaeothamnion confervicola]
LAAGLDFGTSGCRINVVDSETRTVTHEGAVSWASGDSSSPAAWIDALETLIAQVPTELRQRLTRICVSGTSASCLLLDAATNAVTRGPRMYNCNVVSELPPEVGAAALDDLRRIAPPAHTTLSGTSALAKLVAWHLEAPLLQTERLAHQADFVARHLRTVGTISCGDGGYGGNDGYSDCYGVVTTDWNNALKAGYDVRELCWPAWLLESDLGRGGGIAAALPQRVVRPGAFTGTVSAALAARLGNGGSACRTVAGTTDSVAAFIAAGVDCAGVAVTSLGSTLAIKLLSDSFVEDASRGVYSHRLGTEARPLWLVGGASNVGCATLRQEGFSPEELRSLSREIDPAHRSALGDLYYPLPGSGASGERFPTNDPRKAAVLEPRPASRAEYLQAILQAIARVEAEGFAALRSLGATELREVLTAGGGAVNPTWTAMRAGMLGVPTAAAANADAAYGAALLALQ